MHNILEIGRVLSKSVSNLEKDFMHVNIGNSHKYKYFNKNVAPYLHELFNNKKVLKTIFRKYFL